MVFDYFILPEPYIALHFPIIYRKNVIMRQQSVYKMFFLGRCFVYGVHWTPKNLTLKKFSFKT